MGWVCHAMSVGGFSSLLGVIEIAVVLIALRPVWPIGSAVGSGLAVGVFLTTLSFLITTPGWEPSLGGFPALSAMPGQFVLKAVVLLGVALLASGEVLGAISPCFECRRTSFMSDADAWAKGNSGVGRPTASVIDERLQAVRVGPDRSKRTIRAAIADLPDGAFVTRIDGVDDAHLLCEGRLLAWSPGSYTASRSPPGHAEVTVLAPRSTMNVIRTSYVPEVHPSANGTWPK